MNPPSPFRSKDWKEENRKIETRRENDEDITKIEVVQAQHFPK